MREVQWERHSLHVLRSEVGENFASLFRSCGTNNYVSFHGQQGSGIAD